MRIYLNIQISNIFFRIFVDIFRVILLFEYFGLNIGKFCPKIGKLLGGKLLEFSRNRDKIWTINIQSNKKPFKSLNGQWIIKEKDNHCEVSFEIKFEFKSIILDKIIGVVFLTL